MSFPVPPVADDAPELYRRFWQLWSEARFFECHEVLEALWRVTAEPQRSFYQGLIHCAVAIYQHRRGNAVGAARQLVRAQARLERFRPNCCQVEVDGLLASVEQEIAPSLARLDAVQLARLEALRAALVAGPQR